MYVQKLYLFKNYIRISVSNFTSQHLSFPRKTIPYFVSFIICKLIDFLLGNQKTIKCIDGIKFELDTRDLIDFRLFYFGNNEKHIVNYLKNEIGEKEAVLWDIGINIGSIALPLMQACSNLKICGFEPSPHVFERLSRNVNLNPTSRLKIYQKAISKQVGVVDFFVSPIIGNSGLGSLGSIDDYRYNKVSVECLTGDKLIEIEALDPPTFIKIDVEGFEYEVLIGLKNFLSHRNNVKIIYEHEPYRLSSRERIDLMILDFLRNLGFEIYRLSSRHAFYSISSNSLEKLQMSMLKDKCDLVAVRYSTD
jgi:FkbM family methyltransferase